jgi:hypothetical protein
MAARKQARYYRKPRTNQERRENGRRGKWNRAKRNAHNLANAWDDKPLSRGHWSKSWKLKTKNRKQWEKNLR